MIFNSVVKLQTLVSRRTIRKIKPFNRMNEVNFRAGSPISGTQYSALIPDWLNELGRRKAVDR